MLKRTIAVLGLAALTLGVVGCGSGGASKATQAAGDTSQSQASESAASEPEAPPSEEPSESDAAETPAEPEPAEDFRFLMITALSGPAATLSEAQVQSIKAAASQVNEAGGINGRQVVLDIVDDGGDPTRAVGLLRDKIAAERPDAIWPGSTSNETNALLPIITREGIFSIGATGDASKLTPQEFPNYFTLFPPQTETAKRLIEHVKDLGVQSIGLIYGSDAYGTTAAEATEAAATAAGLTVFSESYMPTDLDMTAPLQRLRNQNPDVLWVEAIGGPGPLVLRDRVKIGWDVPVIGDITIASQPLTTLVSPAELAGVTLHVYGVQQFVEPAERSDALAAMLDSITALGPMIMPIHIYSQPYDALWLVKAAAEQAQSTDAAALTEAMESLRSVDSRQWVTFESYGYSAESHFVTPSAGDYAFIAPGPIEDGMIRSNQDAG